MGTGLNIITIILLNKKTILALFIKTFGWDCFAVTVIEEVAMVSLEQSRKAGYLQTFMPLLNMQIRSNTDPRESGLSLASNN